MDDLAKGFKQRLSDELSYKGFGIKEFAAKVGISVSTLNMYLYRNSIPAADVAVKMAKVLNVTVAPSTVTLLVSAVLVTK